MTCHVSKFLLSIAAVAMLMTMNHPVVQAATRIVFIAGNPSHDYGSHEHYAGCRILADTIQKAMPDVKCEIIRNGWPQDDSVLDGAATIVIYSDGGGGHPAVAHLDRLGELMKKGVGLVCLHYAVEVPKGEPGDRFLDWLGGYFEVNWSVNPHWTADFAKLPAHPIALGVTPFKANDEWYFHMRFRPNMQGVTPILSAVAPESTMDRPDGSHSGNPDVRKSVAKHEPQHTAWAFERADGGRSFGYTGGHFHWNWGRPEMSRLVSNAIAWSAKLEVPTTGVKAPALDVKSLQANQDEEVPGQFSAERIQKEFLLIAAPADKVSANAKPGRKLYSSPVVTAKTPGHKVDATVDVRGVKKLFLVVNDGGDGFGCDWADWVNPKLVGASGEKKLTDLAWKKANSQWGNVSKNKNANGQPISVAGQPVADGIGTHANSVIEYELTEGYDKLVVTCALDNGGTSQNNGQATSVQFEVYADAAPASVGSSQDASEVRKAENAVAGLTVHEGVEVQLAASEPTLKSLTNIDVDHRGRVWACEVVNYRRHNGERPEGDRILILEDTNQDGVMDESKVYYQGRDVDSAMGICVLGDKVIVSASPNIWLFTDTNGDDVPDKKELMFTKTGIPQHDHSAHSFLFGPDGKLYWNFGNEGKAIHDAKGNPVKDRWGREINASGKPYRQGMVFRCNIDGSDMEVLGHNFRNNYEVTIDSFGTLWQSDNDDDGNKATRINFVMEFGNYGYTDEFTGAGWQAERSGWEAEIPNRHWHLNDPGVVPTTLITGAGSPTGIMVYEGTLLPKVFQNQVIHCDAGPNVVRAYPAAADGAGYSAKIENIIVGEKDRWFRPADVCTAPDGSLFVSDWYDPGVGGHNMEDMERGRLFRIAPANTKYTVPKFDLSTAEGAIAAFQNPCLSVRYLAWEALMKMDANAKPAVEKLLTSSDPRLRARAIWLLGKLPSGGVDYARKAMKDMDADVRATGIRLARQLKVATKDYVGPMTSDANPVVLRELAVALHEDTSPEMPALWAKLAERYDGKDRWYLEALGVGATNRWDECLDAYVSLVGDKWMSPAGENIVWRSRSKKTASLLVKMLKKENVTEEQTNRLLRSLDFLGEDQKKSALESLLDSGSE